MMRAHAYGFKNHLEGTTGYTGATSKASNLFYYYRLALKFGDDEAAKRYRKKMRDEKIGPTRIASMKRNAHPTGMLTRRERAQFLKTLTQSEKRALTRATRYWRETFF